MGRLGDVVIECDGICYDAPDGGRRILDNVTFKLPKGALVGVIGPNGAGTYMHLLRTYGRNNIRSLMPHTPSNAGKTTLLKIVTGEIQATSGNTRIGTTVAMTLVTQAREGLGRASHDSTLPSCAARPE